MNPTQTLHPVLFAYLSEELFTHLCKPTYYTQHYHANDYHAAQLLVKFHDHILATADGRVIESIAELVENYALAVKIRLSLNPKIAEKIFLAPDLDVFKTQHLEQFILNKLEN